MKDLMRKDKLLVAAFVFSCLMMYISSPDNVGLRELVWDFSFVVAAFAAASWAVVESFDILGSMVLSDDRMTKLNVSGISRDGLITMAENEGLASRKTLEAMSDDDLISLVANMNGAAVRKSYGRNLLMAVVQFWLNFLKKIWTLLKKVVSKIKLRLNGKKGTKRAIGGRR